MILAWEAEKRSHRYLIAWQTALIVQMLTGEKLDPLDILGESPQHSGVSKEQRLTERFKLLQEQARQDKRLKERWTKT